MPIQFPQPTRGNPFDNYKWRKGSLPPQQVRHPNLAQLERPFSSESMTAGVPVTTGPNLVNPGKMYQHGDNSRAVVNPAARIGDGAPANLAEARYSRTLGVSRMTLSGISKNATGAVLGSCRVLVFRTDDKSFVAETTSDGVGAWSIDIGVGGPFFLVEYKAGAPDVAGTSLNTLAPTQV